MSAKLRRITIYPIKSLDGVEVGAACVLPSGALENDRRFALVDAEGKCVNGKRTPAIHAIRAEYDLAAMAVRFNHGHQFSLVHNQSEISEYLSKALGIACGLAENSTTGFPDDTESPGPTLLSTATLAAITQWFPGLTLEETRRRFRANLEIDGVEPFWEDHLVGPVDTTVPFQIGAVHWLGINPCQRCVVPTRDSQTAEPIAGFQKSFAREREAALPAWAPRDRFNHFYRLSVNTRLAAAQSSGVVRVGDALHANLLPSAEPL
ncbi:MAG: MOSC domain-containing protein [Pirellulales bacterium]